jgi:PAS domain S-box-containing protein
MSVVRPAVEALSSGRGDELDFRRLLDALPAAAYTCDADGRITYFNRRAADAWGREPKLNDPADRYCGSFRMFTSEDASVPHDQCWMARCLLENKQYFGEEIGVERPDGHRLVVQAYATPFYDRQGKLAGAVNIILDVTERKRAERQLRQSEEELTDFFDNASLGLHWVGPDGIILRANRAELDLLGYRSDEYLGHHIREFHADSHVIEDILQRLQAGEDVDDYEARLRCKDGSIRHVVISSSVRWENGEFIHTRCFTRDIRAAPSGRSDSGAHGSAEL